MPYSVSDIITWLYFIGHMFGPESKQVDDKLEELNDVVGYLVR